MTCSTGLKLALVRFPGAYGGQTFIVSSKFMTGAYRLGCVFRLVFLKEKWFLATACKIAKSLGWLHNGACNKKNWPRQFCKITIFVKAVFCLSRLIESSKRQNSTVLANRVLRKFHPQEFSELIQFLSEILNLSLKHIVAVTVRQRAFQSYMIKFHTHTLYHACKHVPTSVTRQ